MTDQTPEQSSPEEQVMVALAMADERGVRLQAHLEVAEERNVQLNVEVRRRDQRIAELEQELASLRDVADKLAERGPDPEPTEPATD